MPEKEALAAVGGSSSETGPAGGSDVDRKLTGRKTHDELMARERAMA
jgi:hypothetical protein